MTWSGKIEAQLVITRLPRSLTWRSLNDHKFLLLFLSKLSVSAQCIRVSDSPSAGGVRWLVKQESPAGEKVKHKLSEPHR